MSETVAETGTLPGLPPETPPQNEPATESTTNHQTPLLENLRKRTKGLFEFGGVWYKRGGGKPRSDGKPGKLDVPITAPATALPMGATPGDTAPDKTLDPALVKKCCTAVLKAFKGVFDKILHRKAMKAGYDPREVQQLITDTTITSEESDGFAELAEVCLRKYGVGTQYAPEVGLVAIALGVGVRYLTAFRTLDRVAQEKEPLKEAA